VSPVLLRQTTPLAQVRGPYNAILVIGDAVGDTLYYGRGAGGLPTASAVVADLIDLAVGRAQQTFQALKLWSASDMGVSLMPADAVRSRFYLRLLAADRPGVLADVARILAAHHISISSVIQHEAVEDHEDEIVPLVIMTHRALTGDFTRAISEVSRSSGISSPATFYPVAD
jgi:homoserine dehydrogenase